MKQSARYVIRYDRKNAILSYILRNWIRVANALLLCMVPQFSFAATAVCTISATSVNFGAYDVFAASPNNNGGGSITIVCANGSSGSVNVMLTTGQSNLYAMRMMESNGNRLNYNLYTSPARTAVWGDGTGASNVITINISHAAKVSIFGQIPAGQDATVGFYTDNITAIVNF